MDTLLYANPFPYISVFMYTIILFLTEISGRKQNETGLNFHANPFIICSDNKNGRNRNEKISVR